VKLKTPLLQFPLNLITCAVLLALTCKVEAKEAPIHITADQVEGASERMANAYGNVIVKQGELRADAQWARYDTTTTQLWAGDTVTVEKTGDVLIGKRLEFITTTKQGQLEEPIYFLRNQFGRGDAAKLLFTGENTYQLEKGRFTTCDSGDDSWYIRGSDIDLDFIKNSGAAWHAVFEFKGVPLFYTPWINFPLDGNRQSGLLTPIFGSNSNSGVNVGVPYYWNIAPNYDATFIPQVYTKRGLMLGGEFRYMQPHYQGTIRGEFLSHDRKAQQNRYLWKIQHQQNLSTGLSLSADLQKASDNHYFNDLSNNLQAASTTNLPRDILLHYHGSAWWYASLRSLQYQTLQSNTTLITQPYARSPQFNVGGTPPLEGPLVLDLAGEFNRFRHPTLTTGDRFIVYPTLASPFETSYGFIRPKVGVHATMYTLNKDQTTAKSKHTRTLPMLSLDTGLIFERNFTVSQQEMVQTLEPRLYYVYIPYKDQSMLPNFDSAEVDFNFSQMFSENQFSGGDRINNANQLTGALSTRFYETESGLERLRVGLGQRFYFSGQRVTLSAPARPIEQTRSDVIIGASSQLWKSIAVGTSWQYSVKDNRTNKTSLELAWMPAAAKTLNLRYRLDRTNVDPIRQVDLSGQWPLGRGWYAVGRYNYSIENKKALDTIAGLQYNAGCWGLQLVMQRYVTDNNRMNTSFYIMLDLRGFNGIGNNPISVLRDRIPGYSKIN
jgi:LPS-assembly protein